VPHQLFAVGGDQILGKWMSILLAGLSSAVVLLLSSTQVAVWAADDERYVAVSWNHMAQQQGQVQRFSSVSPWAVDGTELAVGLHSTLRNFAETLYAVSFVDGSITAIDVPSWSVIQTYQIGANSEPLDIAVVSDSIAFVTTRSSTQLLQLNLVSGAVTGVVDLSTFSHPPGTFMAGMMAVDGNRLLVQLARFELELEPDKAQEPRGYLVLVDIPTGQLLDANIDKPGTQAIELAGTFAKYKMALLRDQRRLYVSASGAFFDEGGLEEIDLDKSISLGLKVEEADGNTGADLLSLVMTAADRGYLTSSTDLLPSSHLARFSLLGGAIAEELFVSVDYHVANMVFDPASNSIFVPDGGFQNAVWAFSAVAGEHLNQGNPVVVLSGRPSDIELLCDPLLEFDCRVGYAEIPVFENGFEAIPE